MMASINGLRCCAAVLVLVVGCGGATEEAPPAQTEIPQPVDLLPNQVSPEEGILAGGQPSLEQLAALRDAGYVTVVNLRTEGEKGTGQADVEALGMSYIAFPIAGAEDFTAENAAAFAAILETADRPMVVHCGSGNRVGALFALKSFYLDGRSSDEAVADGLAAGLTGLEEKVRERLEMASGPPPDS